MSIDPRMLTQLLRLQFQTGDPLSPRNANDDTGNFSALLQALLSGADAGETQTSLSLPGAKSYTYMPASAYANNGALHRLQRSAYESVESETFFDPIIDSASEKHGIDPELIKAVIDSESSFNPFAVSSAGAKGLMQIMDRTGESLGIGDPFDPQQNIEGGTRYLAGLLRKYDNNETVALAAYNAGPGRIDGLGIRTDADLRAKLHLLPTETQQYIRKVMDRKRQYASM